MDFVFRISFFRNGCTMLHLDILFLELRSKADVSSITAEHDVITLPMVQL